MGSLVYKIVHCFNSYKSSIEWLDSSMQRQNLLGVHPKDGILRWAIPNQITRRALAFYGEGDHIGSLRVAKMRILGGVLILGTTRTPIVLRWIVVLVLWIILGEVLPFKIGEVDVLYLSSLKVVHPHIITHGVVLRKRVGIKGLRMIWRVNSFLSIWRKLV